MSNQFPPLPHFPTQSDPAPIWLDPVPHDPAPTWSTRATASPFGMGDTIGTLATIAATFALAILI